MKLNSKTWLILAAVALATILIPAVSFAHGVSDADAAILAADGSAVQKLFDFMVLGAKHMIGGYDHLLFILGIVFLLSKFKDVIKYVSYFTLGHSITLIAATVLGISFNYYIIDAIIGLSIAYKGYDNLYGIKKLVPFAPSTKSIVLGFGLIHGFGLSSRLQELPLPEQNLLVYIVSFNVGVEVGQLLALGVFVLLLNQLRKIDFKKFNTFKITANQGLLLAGIFLFTLHLTTAVRA